MYSIMSKVKKTNVLNLHITQQTDQGLYTLLKSSDN